jgi:glycolate oxidase iron-sulfur subunit
MTPPEIEEELLRCMRCGECQAVCPTYKLTGREGEVARGKMRLVKALLYGELGPTRKLSEKLSACLLCKACSSACPSGVRVDKVIAFARRELADKVGLSLVKKTILWGLEHPRVFSGIFKGARTLRCIPRGGEISASSYRYGSNEETRRVVFYAGCMINHVAQEVGDAVEAVLKESGYRVKRVKESCCGLPAYYAGLPDRARQLAKKNINGLQKSKIIVTACPTCAMAFKEYHEFFRGDLREKALRVGRNTYDIAEFLVASESFKNQLAPLDMRVTFHDPCHALHGLGIAQQYRSVIKALPGIKLVEMGQGCCGFGGLFSIEHPSFSRKINARRIKDIAATDAQTVVTSCPGCKYYLQKGLYRGKIKKEVLHVAELLSRGMK